MYAPLANSWTLYATFEELIKKMLRQLTFKCRNAAMLFQSWPTSNTDLSNLQQKSRYSESNKRATILQMS